MKEEAVDGDKDQTDFMAAGSFSVEGTHLRAVNTIT